MWDTTGQSESVQHFRKYFLTLCVQEGYANVSVNRYDHTFQLFTTRDLLQLLNINPHSLLYKKLVSMHIPMFKMYFIPKSWSKAKFLHSMEVRK